MNIDSQNIFSISQINNKVKSSLNQNFSNIWVKGEISSYKEYPSGHIYLTLKDQVSELSSVIFLQFVKQLSFHPTMGLEVLAFGDLSIYTPRGQFQMQIKNLYLFGEGKLWLAYEKLKNKLELEGLFDNSLKKNIPRIPQTIGIITSLEGAVVWDMIKVLKRRAPYIKIYVYPVAVQGKNAANEISRAIKGLEQYGKIELIIVGRGGGSIEDLWSFNDEKVVRAIYDAKIPIISAVGHETDNTLSDYVADYRAPTPSVAAEIAIMDIEELLQKVDHFQFVMIQLIKKTLYSYTEKINSFQKRHGFFKPKIVVENTRNIIISKWNILNQQITNRIKEKETLLLIIIEKLELLNPNAQLQRGYALALDNNKKVIYDPEQVQINDKFELWIARGQLSAVVLDKGKQDDKENKI